MKNLVFIFVSLLLLVIATTVLVRQPRSSFDFKDALSELGDVNIQELKEKAKQGAGVEGKAAKPFGVPRDELSFSDFKQLPALEELNPPVPGRPLYEFGKALPNIFREEDVLLENAMNRPRTSALYRGTKSPPEKVFREGFRIHSSIPINLWGSIGVYCFPLGHPRFKENCSAWIFTSKNIHFAIRYAIWQVEEKDALGYIYEIYKPGGIDVEAIHKKYDEVSDYDKEAPVVFSRPVEPRYIRGAYPVRSKGGKSEDAILEKRFIPNPDFDSSLLQYVQNPALPFH